MEGVHKHYGILLASLAIIAAALPWCSSQTTRRFQFNVSHTHILEILNLSYYPFQPICRLTGMIYICINTQI